MWSALKRNKISSLLLLTILLGVISTQVPIPDDVRFRHINGEEGHTLPWFVYFTTKYVIGFLFLTMLLIRERTRIDRWMVINYFAWDIVGFFSYFYQGWPEPKMIIVGCFCMSMVIFIMIKDLNDD